MCFVNVWQLYARQLVVKRLSGSTKSANGGHIVASVLPVPGFNLRPMLHCQDHVHRRSAAICVQHCHGADQKLTDTHGNDSFYHGHGLLRSRLDHRLGILMSRRSIVGLHAGMAYMRWKARHQCRQPSSPDGL